MRRLFWILLFPALLALPAPAMAAGSNGLFQEIYQDIERYYVDPVNPGSLWDGAIQGMIQSLGDPYTEYFPPQELSNFEDSLAGEYVGLGVELRAVGQDLGVTQVFPDSPAALAGIKPGDRIVTIDGKDVPDLGEDGAMELLKGAPGDLKSLGVERDGKKLFFQVTLATVQIPDFTGRMLPGGFAYLRLPNVNQTAAEDLGGYLASLDSPVRGYILDLRDDPGGDVGAAVYVVEQFVARGTVLSFRGSDGDSTITVSDGTYRGPVAVLVNGGTASAAEMIAAALREDDGAVLIGSDTFGKGVAQEMIPLSNGGALKITTDRWYTPDGENIQGKGLIPNWLYRGRATGIWAAERLLGGLPGETVKLTVGDEEAYLDGTGVALDAAPVLHDGRVFVTPFTLEHLLGANAVEGKDGLTITEGPVHLVVPKDGSATLAGEKWQSGALWYESGGSDYLALRPLSRALGFALDWRNGTVTLSR